MAADALYTGAPTRAPGNIDRNSSLSRRGMLAGIAGAGVAAALPTIALATPDRAWDHRLRAYREAMAAGEAYLASTYMPAMKATTAAAGPEPTLRVTVPAKVGRPHTFNMYLKDMDDWADNSVYSRYAAPVRDAYKAWHHRQIAAERAIGWASIEARMDALDEAEYRLRRELMGEPAPDVDALSFKIVLALDWEDPALMDIREDERVALLADARRLGGAA